MYWQIFSKLEVESNKPVATCNIECGYLRKLRGEREIKQHCIYGTQTAKVTWKLNKAYP